jgi:hypothetical protein
MSGLGMIGIDPALAELMAQAQAMDNDDGGARNRQSAYYGGGGTRTRSVCTVAEERRSG